MYKKYLTFEDVRDTADFLGFIEDYQKAEDRRDRNLIIFDMVYYYDVSPFRIRYWLLLQGKYIVETCKKRLA